MDDVDRTPVERATEIEMVGADEEER